MKTTLLTILRRLPVTLILLLTVSLGLAFLGSGCGSTADAAKANKSKKSKSKKSVKNDEETEKDEASEEEKSENSVAQDEEKESEKSDESEKPDAEKKSDEKKDEKKDEKTSKHDEKEKTGKNAGAEAERIWQALMKGNERYVGGKHTNAQYISSRKQLVKAQKPEVIVLGCSDSRVPPELIFDKNLGELFVVRDAGNITELTTLGSIEYAVEHLHSKVLLILGHESCGAVAAAVSDQEMPSKNLAAIVNRITPAFEDSKTCPLGGKMNNSCVELNIRQSAKDVLSNSPIIKKAVEEGELTIIRAIYRLESGRVERLD